MVGGIDIDFPHEGKSRKSPKVLHLEGASMRVTLV
jgi:hypothetical protein